MTKEVSRWADEAMFRAEPIAAEEGPRVYLLWMTTDPLGAIAAACKMYKGEVVRSLADVTDAERVAYLQQVTRTKLQAPFEFVKFHFMIEGVTRAFTHQMVRQRTAVYAQESMRFAVKEDMPVALPPSLAGTTYDAEAEYPGGDTWGRLSNLQRQRVIWEQTKTTVEAGYNALVNMGMPAEDARGLAPTNVLTRLHYSTDLRALLDHAGNRLCTQAQFEWRLVFTRIVETIRAAGSIRIPKGMITGDPADGTDAPSRVWMAEKLADLFRPVCYATGKCEFMAEFDRTCAIRDRVQANHAIGRPSNEWHMPMYEVAAGKIDSIHPEEWLLDPGAAR